MPYLPNLPNRLVPPFIGFTDFTPSIPKLYWDVQSQEQRILAICKLIDKLICYADMLAEHTDKNEFDIMELQELFKQFMASGFDDYYFEQVTKWIDEHLDYIYRYTIKQIYFGLDDYGHLVGYIPESWEQIVFSTPMDYSDQDTYGRLVLSYDVEP